MSPTRPQSLLDAPQQAALPLALGGPIEPAASDEEITRRPVFTGEAVYRTDPERYRLFCALFFDAGIGQMQACRVLGMSPQTGAAIIAREQSGMTAQQLRDMQAARARAVVTASLSAIQERLSDPEALKGIPLHHLAQTLQRAHEVGAMLAGDATSRVERVDAGARPSRDAAADYLDSIAAADVREMPPAESIPAGKIGEGRTDGAAAGSGAGSGSVGGSAAGEDGARETGADLGADAPCDSESPVTIAPKAIKTGDRDDLSGESYAHSYASVSAGAGPAVSVGAGGQSVGASGRSVESAR